MLLIVFDTKMIAIVYQKTEAVLEYFQSHKKCALRNFWLYLAEKSILL